MAYRDVILADGPKAYYILGESSGTTAVDEVGFSDGTYSGSPGLGASGLLEGDPNTAVDFDGVDDKVNCNFNDAIPQITMEVWVNADQSPHSGEVSQVFRAGEKGIINWSHTSSSFHGVFTIHIGGAWRIVSFDTLDPGVRYHLVGTYDGSTLKCYKNGALINSLNFAGTPNNTGLNWEIASGPGFWPGIVQHVALYDYALTAEQVLNHYNAGLDLAAISEGTFVDAVEIEILDERYRAAGETYELALHTAAVEEDGSVANELSGGSYSRESVVFTDPSVDTPISNTAEIQFNNLPSSTIHSISVHKVSDGSMISRINLETPIDITAGQTLVISQNMLQFDVD